MAKYGDHLTRLQQAAAVLAAQAREWSDEMIETFMREVLDGTLTDEQVRQMWIVLVPKEEADNG